jgi:hypothetical protein
MLNSRITTSFTLHCMEYNHPTVSSWTETTQNRITSKTLDFKRELFVRTKEASNQRIYMDFLALARWNPTMVVNGGAMSTEDSTWKRQSKQGRGLLYWRGSSSHPRRCRSSSIVAYVKVHNHLSRLHPRLKRARRNNNCFVSRCDEGVLQKLSARYCGGITEYNAIHYGSGPTEPRTCLRYSLFVLDLHTKFPIQRETSRFSLRAIYMNLRAK